jgi:nucleoside-diphosphate-sugar epimerase
MQNSNAWQIKDKHILVLGGAGYLGSLLVRKLLRMKYTVTVYDNFLYESESLDGIDGGDFLSVVRGDVRDYDRLREVIAGKDVIVNLAAIVGDAACDLDVAAAKAINADANKHIYKLADELGVKLYVCASTCSVYGFSDDLLDEESFLNPVSLYAQTKLTSELLLFSMRHKVRPAMTVLRFATLFGWSKRPRFDLVVNTMASHAVANGKVTVFGGNQWRPHLHVMDAAESIISVIEAPKAVVDGEIFNVGGNELNMTILELGERIAGLVPGCTVERKQDIIDPRNYLVDFSKIKNTLGFKPRFDIQYGVGEIRRSFEEGKIETFEDPLYSNVNCLKSRRDRRRVGTEPIGLALPETLPEIV